MDLQSRKILFVQEFLNLQNEEIIQSLEDFLRFKKNESSDEKMKPMSIDQFNREINLSMEDSKQGRITKATDIKEKYSK
jgi:hypothetical protein